MMNANLARSIEGVLSRSEMKLIKGGGNACFVYCCTHGGNCSGGTQTDLPGSTNEECQQAGNDAGYECSEGTYLAALYKSTEPEVA